MVHGMIDTGEFEFEPYLADVEELNQLAQRKVLPVTKLSFNAFLTLTDEYGLLDAGSALGHNCGPLLISKQPLHPSGLAGAKVAIPGEHTTANFLLDFYLDQPMQKETMRFDQIESAVLEGEVAAGVIIHENRFTYANRGLRCIQDLGAFWEEKTKQPIPLGGIVMWRELGRKKATQVSNIIRESLDFARQHPTQVMAYVQEHAQEMDQEVMRQHIDLYVNDYSSSLSGLGQAAIENFFSQAVQLHRIEGFTSPFLN